MSQEKERVRQVSGEPRGRAGEPKQDPDRGAEITEGPLLPQGRVAAAVGGGGLQVAPVPAQKDSRTKTASTVFVFLLTRARRVPVNPKKLSFFSRCLCLSRLKCPTRSACGFVRGEKSANGRRRRTKCRRFPRTHPAGSSQVKRTTHAGPPAAATRQRNHVYVTTSGSSRLRVCFWKHSSTFVLLSSS